MLSSKLSKLSLLRNTMKPKFFKFSTPLQNLQKLAYCHQSGHGHDYPVNMIRRPAPEFSGNTWWNGEFKKVSLNDLKGKWVCLFFYPLDFTFVCPTEIVDFNSKAAEFENLNCVVIGCSTDSHFTHREFALKPREQGGLAPLSIPLLADVTHNIGKSYGVLVSNPEDPLNGLALRGTFLIDEKGILRHSQVNDANVGRNVDETLRILRGFQYADKHGEVCPAKWVPGKATIAPASAEKVSEYWKKEHATKH